MTVAPQAETEVVTGIIQGIVQKGTDDYGNPDKWQVEVNTGQQNPRRLWTKDANLIGQLSAMVGQQQSFLCGKSHWTNQSGQPVTSLWINGVGMPQQAQPPQVMQQPQPQTAPMPQQVPIMPMPQPVPMQPAPQLPQVTQVTQYVPEEVREDRIMRQAASKVAGILISHVPVEQRTLENVIAISERLLSYYRNGVSWPQDGQQPTPDDDIPF